jgi:hypothetical protein
VSCRFRCNRRAVGPGLHKERDPDLLNMANTPPQPIAALCAPAILAVSRADYTLLSALTGAAALLGAAILVELMNVR